MSGEFTFDEVESEEVGMNAAKSSWRDTSNTPTTWIGLFWEITRRQGLWAAIFVASMAFLGWELHWAVRTVGAAVTAYVAQSGENIKALNAAVSLLSKNLERASQQILSNGKLLEGQQGNVDSCVEILGGVQKSHEMQIKQSQDILGILDTANKMMSPVPSKHDEEISLLKEIVEGIKKPNL